MVNHGGTKTLYFIMDYNADSLKIRLVDEDTLKILEVDDDEFISLFENREIGGNFGRELIFHDGWGYSDVVNLLKTYKLHLVFDVSEIDVEVVGENTVEFIISSSDNSWRSNKIRYYRNNIFAHGDGEVIYVWYKDTLFTVLDVYLLLGMYLDDNDALHLVFESFNGVCDIRLSTDIGYISQDVIKCQCSLNEVKRKILIGS